MSLIGAISNAMAEATIGLIAENPEPETDYGRIGFEIFWRGIANE